MTRRHLGRWALACTIAVGACGADQALESRDGAPGAGADAGTGGCFQDTDCPSGLSCLDFACVTDEGLPPEVETPRTFLRPVASERYVFALSPEADTVAVIDPATLAISSVLVPDEPFALSVVKGRDAAFVLSRTGRALSYLDLSSGTPSLTVRRTPRRYSALTLSDDGRWAVLWTPDGEIPDAGTEGIVGLVDIDALVRGEAAPVLERAAGRRHTNVLFRMDQPGQAGRAVDAVFVGKEEIAVMDLTDLENSPVPRRIRLPEAYTEILTREAVTTPDGEWVLLRSITSTEVAALDVASRTLATLDLEAPVSDLDLSVDGTRAVAVLRKTGEVAWFPIPAALSDPALVQRADVPLPALVCPAEEEPPCFVSPGQAELAPDGGGVALFTNAQASETFAWFEFASTELVVYDRLEKLVRTVGISPTSRSAIVLHRPNPSSTVADLYERSVDHAEGYSLVDLQARATQLKLTDDVAPVDIAFSTDGDHAAVTLDDPNSRRYTVDAIDLRTLVTVPLDLASAPQFSGALPGSDNETRVWVTQSHPAGRISFVDLAEHAVRTATGFELNAGIENGGTP